jgi:alanine dehydrogenase
MEDSDKFSSKVSFEKNALMPQEEKLEQKRKEKKFVIGVPRESSTNENRVSLAPHAIELLVRHNHRVIVETGAGERANFSDQAIQ